MEDDVSLPRIYIAWHSPAVFADGDAALDTAGAILAHGRASRLYRSLVYEKQLAQSVSAYQGSAVLGSTFRVVVTARPGVSLSVIEQEVRSELEAMSRSIGERELERAVNGIETGFVDSLQNVGGFGGRADQLNMYLFHTGEPDYAAEDLRRYAAKLQFELAFWSDFPDGADGDDYSRRLTAATGVRYRPDAFLSDMDAGFYSADYLRAWILWAQLRKHMKKEFGPEWYNSAEAGAYLLGLWGLPMPIVEAVAHHQQPGRMRMSGFWVAGAVHVASALVAGTPVDEAYLRSVGQIDKLPKWRSLSEQMLEAA